MISCLISKANRINFVLKIYSKKKSFKSPLVCGHTPKRTYVSLSQKLLHIMKECQHAIVISPHVRNLCHHTIEIPVHPWRNSGQHTTDIPPHVCVSTPYRYLHTHICCITIHNSQDMKLSQMSTNKWRAKEHVISFSLHKMLFEGNWIKP